MKPLLLLCLVLVGCYEVKDDRTYATKEEARFSARNVSGTLYIIHDHQTGKEYLSRSQGGFIEVEPTKP